MPQEWPRIVSLALKLNGGILDTSILEKIFLAHKELFRCVRILLLQFIMTGSLQFTPPRSSQPSIYWATTSRFSSSKIEILLDCDATLRSPTLYVMSESVTVIYAQDFTQNEHIIADLSTIRLRCWFFSFFFWPSLLAFPYPANRFRLTLGLPSISNGGLSGYVPETRIDSWKISDNLGTTLLNNCAKIDFMQPTRRCQKVRRQNQGLNECDNVSTNPQTDELPHLNVTSDVDMPKDISTGMVTIQNSCEDALNCAVIN